MQAERIQLSGRKIRDFFARHRANSLAKKFGATHRKHRKFTIADMVISYWMLTTSREFSFDKWATQISILRKVSISGQALWKRMKPEVNLVLKELLNKSLQHHQGKLIDKGVYKSFKNVFVQDATHLSLPRCLAAVFPGSHSKYGATATAKIQAVFNMKTGRFTDFLLQSFRDNDQKDSPRLLEKVSKGDLIIRDLGYFVLSVFERIKDNGGFFLTRLPYGIKLITEETEQPIDLVKLIEKQQGIIDMNVKMGNKQKVSCRLVGVKVPEQVANERRRKAKKDRNKKAKHSKEYLFLLGYTFYVTNVDQKIWSPNDIEKAYRGRWYIEILFKGWKSHLRFNCTIPERYINQARVEFLIYTNLLLITLLVIPAYIFAHDSAMKKGKYASILKVCSFIANNLALILVTNKPVKLLNLIQKLCLYESRKDRCNAIEYLAKFYP
jgi:hypothetical protein